MRFMVLVKADKNSEAGIRPDAEFMDNMGKYNDQLIKAGVMLDGGGLQASSKGARLKYEAGRLTVTDGPFAETKELFAGFWIWKVNSKEEAVAWAKRAPFGQAEVEIRLMYDVEDFST